MACRTYRRTAMLLVAIGCFGSRVASVAAQETITPIVVDPSVEATVVEPPWGTTFVDPSVIPPLVDTMPTPTDEFLNGAVPVAHHAAVASRDPRRWYIGLNGGWQERETAHEVDDARTFTVFDSGFLINAQLGYRFDLFRVEAEYSFMNNEVERAGAGAGPLSLESAASGNVNLKAFMFNVYHDFNLFDWLWEPYVGAGIGTYQSEINSLYPEFFGGVPDVFFPRSAVNTTSDMQLAYQFRAGMSRPVGQRTELLIGYRYFKGEELEFASEPFATAATPTFHPDGAEIHSLEAGLRVRF